MMRVKVPGGVLTAAQAREIGVAADAFAEGPDDSPVFGNRYADLTTRQDIQLHWIRIADVPRIWQRFWTSGSRRCRPAATRPATCCSLPGRASTPSELVDALPVAQAISAYFTGNREYANLPRKFKIAVTGCREDCAQVEINDIGLWPAEPSDGAVGFNVLVGGGLSDGERMASDIDVFIRPDQAVELCRGVAQLFGELGNRENRGLARMRYLVQELGPEGFRAALDERDRSPRTRPAAELTDRYRGDHVGVHAQKQPGLFYVGCSVPVGRMHGIELIEAARLAETYGDGTVRLGTDQNFILSGVPEERLDDLLAEPLLQTYSPFPGPFERGVVACTGSEFCRFAVVETKERAVKWARRLDAQLATERPTVRRGDAGVIRMHFSGCSASCAQPQIADIGFRGDIAHVDEHIEEAVDIGLGGSLGPDAAFIDWVDRRPAGRPGPRRARACGRRATRTSGAPGEPFHPWARRTPSQASWRRRSVGAAGGGRAREALPRPRADERHRRATREGVVLGARGGRDRRRPLHRVRDLRGRVPLELHRGRRGHQSARAGQDVHGVLAVLGLLSPRGPALRGTVAAVDDAPATRRPRCCRRRSAPTPRTPTGRSPVARPADGLGCGGRELTPCGPRRTGRRPGRGCGQRAADRAAGGGRDRRRAGLQAERRSRRAVEGCRHHRHHGGRDPRRRRAASTTRPWRWPSSTCPATSCRPSPASPWSGRRARCRGCAPCRPGAGRRAPTASTPSCSRIALDVHEELRLRGAHAEGAARQAGRRPRPGRRRWTSSGAA